MKECAYQGCSETFKGNPRRKYCSAKCKSAANNDRIHSRDPWYFVFRSARKRAKRQGVPFNLPRDLPIPDTCPVLGIPLVRGGVGSELDNSPSLDRLVPEKGYTVENVRVISRKANSFKSNATPNELRAIADWIESEQNNA